MVPDQPSGGGAVQQADLEGNGKNEVLVTYSNGANPPVLGAALFSKQKGQWQKLWSVTGQGYAVSYAGFADLTGEGRPELLLGWRMGTTVSGLDIYTMSGQNLQKMTSLCYSKLDVGNFTSQKGSHGTAQLAVWQHDTGDAYQVEVLGWNGKALVPDGDAYLNYFPKVVSYYQEQLKGMPDAVFYWYYLADAQLKVGQPQAAIDSARQSLAILAGRPDNYYKGYDLVVEGNALNAQQNFTDAQKVLQPLVGKQQNDGTLAARLDLALGDSYRGQLNDSKAEELYQAAIDRLVKDYANSSVVEKLQYDWNNPTLLKLLDEGSPQSWLAADCLRRLGGPLH
ncbi:hypothetical protein [Desulfosporosinus sp. FKA]|uniref:tetratricopeptide repeat protein n=1 Tax=Desulfosporosinus sp. FKA TaxID=1969834 RepID=UPI0015525E2F|nr:hypothetical protein [Desulfosporosinus sp. FKA]